MADQTLETEINELRSSDNHECPISQILEGERVGRGNWKDVFHNSDFDELSGGYDVVAKVFGSQRISNIRKRVERMNSEYFPESVPVVCDTTAVENPELSVKEQNAVVVIQNRSDESIIDDTPYNEAVAKSTEFTDALVSRGQIMDDFKLEAIHRYGDDLKYVDFEDSEAIKDWPLHEDHSTPKQVSYNMALMYANLSTGISDAYDVPIAEAKDDIVSESSIIDDEVYENNGFVPEMVTGWGYN